MYFSLEAPSHSPNYIKGILDEISLEGLDGITIIDLWLRLEERPHFPFKPNDNAAYSFLWEAAKRLRDVTFYELPEPRQPLIIYDRFAHIDPELGMIIEPDDMPQNIYPFLKIEDQEKGIIGSCATYYTRKDVSEAARASSYEDVIEKWGRKLVVVASAACRRRALLNQDVNPNLELTTMQYVVLERVGRSRYHGDVTQGRDSLQTVGEDAKTLFYLRKVLHKHRLITKQMFHQKLGNQNTCGLLLHLPRFFVERRPKALVMTEKVVTYLKNKPNHMEEINILRQRLDLGPAMKKLCKTFNFQKFVKSDLVLYRKMYPDAPEEQWRYKAQNKEKSVRVLFLTDPNVDASEVWQKYDDIYDDEDDDKCGLLDGGHRLLDRTLMSQAYNVLKRAGPEGTTQVELGMALGASKLAARMLVRNLSKSDKVTMFLKDEGRQRTARFALKKFDKSIVQQQMSDEKNKLLIQLGNKDKSKKIQRGKQLNEGQPSCSKKLKVLKPPEVVFVRDDLLDPRTQMDIEFVSVKQEPLLNNIYEDIALQASTSTDLSLTQATDPEKTPKKNEATVKNCQKPKGRKRKKNEEPSSSTDDTPQTKKRRKKMQEESTEENKSIEKDVNIEVTAEHTKDTDDNTTDTVENADIPVQVARVKEHIEVVVSNPNDTKLLGKRLRESDFSGSGASFDQSGFSFRMLKRTNMIIEAVHKQQVIFDTSKLQKMIFEEESREGYNVRMDKKSLLRIISKLAMDGHVKHIQMTLKGHNKVKTLTFICHPSVTTDHSVIQSAVDQAKMKFLILGKDSTKKKKPRPVQENEYCLHSKALEIDDLKYNGTIGRLYGFKPKYMRMQVLHKYMFYLIYGYEGSASLNQKRALEEIDSVVSVSADVRDEISEVYSTTIDWKMFLPPLPVHSEYSNGWALMSDMLLRLPLSIFIQLVNVNYELPREFEDYLNHPIKKHLLVKNLPLKFRSTLTFNRKYIFTIHELVVRMCCTGLLQMGPQRLKEKDQVFVYLNHRALLWDTTSSPAGYHQIAKDRDYPVHQFTFRTMADVEQYWYDLWNFCMHTMLGGRMCVSGQTVVLDNVQTKPEMVEALESRNIEEAQLRDTGYLPGDQLGAGGFDSAMFAHLKRNWYWNTSKTNVAARSTDRAPTTDLQPIIQKEKIEKTKPAAPQPKVTGIPRLARVISETSSARRRARRERPTEPKEGPRQVKRKMILKRTVRMLKYRIRSQRKPYYDQIDREALLKMNKLRVDWSKKEDNLLLLCKVAFVVFHQMGKRCPSLTVVREILHEQCPESTDKTSRACQRRLNYTMKNAQTQRSVNLCVEEMKQDPVVLKKLKVLTARLKPAEGKPKLTKRQREDRWNEGYKELVLLLQERYRQISSQQFSRFTECAVLTDSVDQLHEEFRILRPQKLKKRGFYAIHNISDIHAGVINATILSSLHCVADKTSWSYQLFNIYQQYPDKLLRTVMAKARDNHMVSLRKRYLRTHIRSGDYLPLSSSPYQLSMNYQNLMLTRYQWDLYGDCVEMMERLGELATCESSKENQDDHIEVVASKGGIAACVVEYATQNMIDFKLEIPDQIIVMDPSVVQKDETYIRIVQRYQDILSKCKEQDHITMTAIFDDIHPSQDLPFEEEPPTTVPPTNVIAKAASRIALYLTREEWDNKSVDQKEIQHAHDFFVVNATRVFCKISERRQVIEDFIPLSKHTMNSLLNKIKRLAIFPDKRFVEKTKLKEISKNLEVSQEIVEHMLEFIESKKEIGATYNEIREKFGTTQQVASILNTLVDSQICLRCGVLRTHIVHRDHARPWVIRSYRITRLELDNLANTEHGMLMNIGDNVQSGELVDDDENSNLQQMKEAEKSNLDKEENERFSTDKEVASPNHNEIDDGEPHPSSSSGAVPSRKRKPPTRFEFSTPTDTVQDPGVKRSTAKLVHTSDRKVKIASPDFDSKTKNNLNVCVRPWIRIDGTLNRKVLDKMLGSVLGHIMILPLCSLKMVQERFTPAFQPHHTRELVEMLAETKCLKMVAVRHTHRPSLLSTPTSISTVPATGLEMEEHILLEPDAMAVSRLSCFINHQPHFKESGTQRPEDEPTGQ